MATIYAVYFAVTHATDAARLATHRADASKRVFRPDPVSCLTPATVSRRIAAMAPRTIPFVLTVGLLSCAVPGTDVVVSAIAIPGDWVPPANTLAISNPQYVPVVEPPAVTGTCMSTCPTHVWGLCVDVGCTGQLQGTVDIATYIRGRWSYVGAGGDYSCRRNSNPMGCTNLSVHSVGRAVDLMMPMDGSEADNTLGDAVANWLIENAEYIGVQRVIWDGRYWSGNRINDHFRDIDDSLCSGHYCTDHHINHIHLELSVDGANRRTRFFTEGPPPTTCPVVCYGNAAVRADCTFVDCAATGQVCVDGPPRCSNAEAPTSVLNPGVSLGGATPVGGLVRFQPVAPARVFDTRTPTDSSLLLRSDGTTGSLGPGRTGTISAFPGLPAGATGVWLNVAAVPQTDPGFIAVFPAGSSTDTSTLNYGPPLPRANATAIALGAGGGVTFLASSNTDVITDLTGAFAPTGLGLRTVVPMRVLDTRATSPIAAGTQLAVDLHAPADARGVVVSIAVIPRGVAGYLDAFPCDAGRPPTSNVNYGSTDVVSNTVMSSISSGQLCFHSQSDIDLVVDVTGYLIDAGELSLQLITPLRLLDTRNATSLYAGRLGDGQIIELPIGSIPGLPADARAALVNLTSVDAATDGYATAFPCGIDTPNTSSFNYTAGSITGSAAVSELGTGRLCVFSNSRTHLIVDLLGVWVPTPGSTPTEGPTTPPYMPEPPTGAEPDAGTTVIPDDASTLTDSGASIDSSVPVVD